MTDSTGTQTAPAQGRTRVMPRALSRIVAAVSADVLGVQVGDVGIELRDDRGLLAFTVSAPITAVSLSQIQHDDRIVELTGGSLLERSANAEQTIRARVTALTGSHLGHITLRLTGIRVRPESRVR